MLERFLRRLLTGARRNSTAVLASAVLATIAGIVLIFRISFDADILRLLPRDSPAVRSFQTFLQDFGSLDHLYIVFDAPERIGEHTDLVDAYVAALREAPEVESVDAQLLEPGMDWSYLSDRVLYLLGPAGAANGLARFSPPGLGAEIAHARDLLSMPSADIKTYVQQDPIGLLGLLKDRLEREKGPVAFDPSQAGYVSADGRSRLVIVKPKGAPFDSDFCRALFDRLTHVEQAARASALSAGDDATTVTVQAAGAYRVSLEAERLIRRDSIVNSIGSVVLLLAVVYGLFRTPWIVVYGTLPLVLAALLALGLNGAMRASLSPATSGSAGMLFGLGIDGVVLLYLRYLEERQRGQSADEATARMAGTAASVVLAQATTVATFFALLIIDFPTLQDLGALVGLGMLLVCVFTLVLMPAVLARSRSAERGRALSAPWLGAFVTRRSSVIVWVSVSATIALGAASTRLRLDTRIERLQAKTPGADLERAIAERFSLPLDVLLVLNQNASLEALLDADARLGQRLAQYDPTLAVSGVGMLLPPAAAQADVARQIRAAAITTATVDRDLAQAAAQAGFRPDIFRPFLERVPRLVDPDARITYDGLIERGLGSVVSRFVTRRNGQYVALTYLYPRQPPDLTALERVVHDVDPALQLTGLSVVNHDLAARVLPEFLKGIAIGSLAVAILLYSVFRTIRYTLLALVPTAIGFIWSAGILAILRVELDLFSLFAAVTFIGIAVDYGIYVLYRYAVEGSRDMGDVLTRTGAAVAIACLTALIGFGSMINSSYDPLRIFGIVSIVTLSCCLAASLLFLPALILRFAGTGPRARHSESRR